MTKHLNTLLLAVLMAASTSCWHGKTVVRADDYDAETIVDLMNEESPKLTKQPSNHHPLEVLPKKHMRATPISGEWTIVKAGGMDISLDEGMPYVIFSDTEGRFYAFNGCNYLNGDYTYDQANGEIVFANVVSTMADCPHLEFPSSISVVLNEGVSVKSTITEKGRESYMTFSSNSGDILMTLRRHNLDVANGQWRIESIDGEKVDSDGLNVFLDIPAMKIHGNTGCNFFNGEIEIDPSEPSSISFTRMGVTMRMCENAQLERMMLVALEETTSYALKDANTLELKNQAGTTVLKLVREQP